MINLFSMKNLIVSDSFCPAIEVGLIVHLENFLQQELLDDSSSSYTIAAFLTGWKKITIKLAEELRSE